MGKGKGSSVDAEVRAELAEFKSEINSTIIESISNGFREVEKHLSQLFNKDIEHIKETQNRFADNHKKHFESHENIIKELSGIEKLVNSLSTSIQAQDKIEEKTDRKKEITVGLVGTLCAVSSLIVGVIVYLVK